VTDDAALVRRCLDGDEQAPRELVERFQSMVFSVCYRMLGQREDAEDVAQDVFLRAFRGLKGWDSARPLRPWLLAIAANRCRTALQHRSRSAVRHAASLTEAALADTGTADAGTARDLAEELQRALEEVREEYRLCFVLFYQQGLSCAEIAAAMESPEGTIKTWLHRTRRELAERLRRRGVVPYAEYELHGV
jgi:RNA polymerase sigma-70 factor (ECF subfamily)